ncbi:MAG: hypothetical protein EA367_15820 [Leptolyngbya sp. DLM2.Bin15]|nr:MAG: hypothetical protein EA367_15820 [Leptolyngbya sp. DLM2.Bin15]
MTKRIQVTVSDLLAEQLQEWADSEGRPISNLCAYLLERSVADAKVNGLFSPQSPFVSVQARKASKDVDQK